MDAVTHKRRHHSKSQRSKAQAAAFASTFPYRFSWLTESPVEALQPWESEDTSVKDLLPLQKSLVPTRSIPVP
uniref:Uncharacterized protein n=1 Tax=Microcebus murinus TaxID=30608 RepID=A0A8C5YGD7_MICMU